MVLRRPGAAVRDKEFAPSDPVDLLVVGIGNPGPDFEATRHNAGWDVVGILARRAGVDLSKARKERAMVGVGRVEGLRLALAQPLTQMNLSGEAVRPLVKRFGIEVPQLVVVHDDIDLAFGRLRVLRDRGTGGHQGVNSIVAHLHSKEFARVKVGVGRPPGRMDPADYVLRRFSRAEREQIDVTLEEAADAVVVIGTEGVEAAMNRFNTRTDPQP